MRPLTPFKITGPLIAALLIASCSSPNQQPIQKDSAKIEPLSLNHELSGNEVKVEAPDATSKTEQGYAMPRYSEKNVQSPINIITDSAVKDSAQDISIKFNADVNAVENLGHTVQLDFKDGSTTLAGGRTYTSKQFHFHTPSEHLIDGMTYPMELHIVSVLKDSNSKNNPQFLVLGILFKMGKENKFIKEFLNSVPHEEGKDTLPAGAVKFQDLFNTVPRNESAGYFTYKGSLTTPPYSETVNWVVKKYILEASPEQISAIEKLEGDNARHVQALYARRVVSH
jgi:carbonic anhydrase